MKQTVRIIGGLYRGKKLHFPAIEGLRPTPDRIRETLFNWLMHDIKEARCLDAFAGSGALGFEAFSRGADQVVFVEQNRLAQESLKKAIAQFPTAAEKLHLVKEDARDYVRHCKEQFDLIFLDPPFSQNYLPQCLDAIISNQLLSPRGLVYIETAKPPELNPHHWQQLKQKQAGQVIYGLFHSINT